MVCPVLATSSREISLPAFTSMRWPSCKTKARPSSLLAIAMLMPTPASELCYARLCNGSALLANRAYAKGVVVVSVNRMGANSHAYSRVEKQGESVVAIAERDFVVVAFLHGLNGFSRPIG